MTAEIAILNKSAIALAADSAVTISTTDREEKIYDTADKLFDLSHKIPVGLMLYNGMQFVETPLHILINDYRDLARSFDTIDAAAFDFLSYLSKHSSQCSADVERRSLERIIGPVLARMRSRVDQQFSKMIQEDVPQENFSSAVDAVYAKTVSLFQKFMDRSPSASFIPDKKFKITKRRRSVIADICDQHFSSPANKYQEQVVEIAIGALVKEIPPDNYTGLVFAGFGEKEFFPTLVSYEVSGTVFGHLKYKKTNKVDIDRDGERARVLPFAQQEMVERFLYGLDSYIERNIAQFCENTVPNISEGILNAINVSDDDRVALDRMASTSADGFMKGLRQEGFKRIRDQARSEVEDMVEFMPKPEMANMAEALINLTSMKRKVSRGMETVGGPIDVAVISRSDGFIWVRRKHYFSADLNLRYLNRVREKNGVGGELNDS